MPARSRSADSDATVEITGDGVSLIDPTGALNFTTLDIFNSGGTGLLVDTKGGGTTFTLTTGPDSTIVTTGGPAMSLDPLDVNLHSTWCSPTTSPTNGIFIDTVTGQIRSRPRRSTLRDAVDPDSEHAGPADDQLRHDDIDSLISDAFADNIDTRSATARTCTIDFDTLTITGP